MSVRGRFYIDGFNFYYGAVKGTPWRWLDFEAMCGSLVRGVTVEEVHYFTARVTDRPDDPGQAQRQDTYLRALGTLPLVQVTFGHFATRSKSLPTVASVRHPPIEKVRVQVDEEKGSDVNLAAWLLHDAFEDLFDVAVVVSNDSDLQTPVEMVQARGKAVYVVNPHRHGGQKATLVGTQAVHLRRWHLEKHQLPDEVIGADGRPIRRPPAW